MLYIEIRHIEGGETEDDEDEEYDNFDMDYRFGRLNLSNSGTFNFHQQCETFLNSQLDKSDHEDPEDIIEFHLFNDSGDIELDSDLDIAEEQANINRIMGYKNYPEILIDDPDAGFPLLHEIDFDDQQSIDNWTDKTNSSNQWQEQFAQWSLHTQKN